MSQKKIMVIKQKTLFPKGKKNFYGDLIAEAEEVKKLGLYRVILENLIPKDRGLVENDFTCKQPIPYRIIRDTKSGNVFFYRCSNNKETCEEGNLLGKESGGIGIHAEIFDVGDDQNSILRRAIRELYEDMATEKSIKLVGIINDDSDLVGKVHIGLVVPVGLVKVSSLEIDLNQFISFIAGERKLPYEVENWINLLAENEVF